MPVSLERASRLAAGEVLPDPYQFMGRIGWHLRLGWVTLIAAAPGVGKSAFAMDLVRRLRLRTLYLCADTDLNTLRERLLAGHTNTPMSRVRMILDNDPGGEQRARKMIREYYPFLQVSDGDGSPSLVTIDEELRCCTELWGDWPQVVVIDNLSDIHNEDESEHRGLKEMTREFRRYARLTGALWLVLHHVTAEFEDGQKPPPRRALDGKVSKTPEQVVTLGSNGTNMGLAVVKDRGGVQDPTAANAVWPFLVDYASMSFKESVVR